MKTVESNGNFVLSREKNTPDTERQVERDDPLYTDLFRLFSQQDNNFDLIKIAEHHGVKPEDVFADLHENYGYICIGTGENPALNEQLNNTQKADRKSAIKDLLAKENIPYAVIEGKYMGVVEESYLIPFQDKHIGLSNVLHNNPLIKKIADLATLQQQESLLITHAGYSCYLYTSGPQTGAIVAGNKTDVFSDLKNLPADCYSIVKKDNKNLFGFNCQLNFDRTYKNIEEFVAEENKSLQSCYQDFVTTNQTAGSAKKKTIILLRGLDGYNKFAIELKKLLSERGLKAYVFGTDANIAKLNIDISSDNTRENWSWPQVRHTTREFNAEIYKNLISADCDVVIFADMNKKLEYIKSYITTAINNSDNVMLNVVNSYMFVNNPATYKEKLVKKYGLFMNRHFDGITNPKEQIKLSELNVNEQTFKQYHVQSAETLANLIVESMREEMQPVANTFEMRR